MGPSEDSLVVLMMSHHRVPCTGPNRGSFLKPSQSWILRRCSIHDPAVAESVIRNCCAAENVAAGPTLSAERLLHPLGQSDGGDGYPRLLRRRWGESAKTSFSVVLWAAPTVAMTKTQSMFLSVPFRVIPTMVDLLAPAVPPTIKPR